MPRPTANPIRDVRVFLTSAKRHAMPFDRAWTMALERARYQHDTGHRRQTKVVLAEMRGVFEDAYHDRDVPGGPAMVALWDRLAELRDDDHDPSPVRVPPTVVIAPLTVEGRRRMRDAA